MKIIGGYPYGPLQPARVTTNAEGWDIMVERELAYSQSAGVLGENRYSAEVGGIFFLQSKACVDFIGCNPVMEYRSLGLQAGKNVIIEGTGYSERLVGLSDNGVPGGPTGQQHVSVAVARVGVIARYLAANRPNCAVVGTRQEPPQHFGIGAYPFSYLTNPRYAVPYGWVMDRRIPKQLPHTNWWTVEDEYGFYWQENFNPG